MSLGKNRSDQNGNDEDNRLDNNSLYPENTNTFKCDKSRNFSKRRPFHRLVRIPAKYYTDKKWKVLQACSHLIRELPESIL